MNVVQDTESADSSELLRALAGKTDEYLRLAADFDNFRKRTRRESEHQAAAEKESFIRELLPILDNLERALACEHSTSSAQLHQGVQMTLQQFGRLLREHGIEATKDCGIAFDPHRHEALSLGHDPMQPDHSVLEVVQRGYRCGDKVFRPAKVVVNDWAHTPGGVRVR